MNYLFLEILIPSLIALVLLFIGLAIRNHRFNRKRMAELELAIKELQSHMSPFWASLQTKIADALHHPKIENKVLDNLLEKLEALELTSEERVALVAILMVMVEGQIVDQAEKAGAMLEVMPMVVREAAGELPETDQRSMWVKRKEHSWNERERNERERNE